MKKKIMNKLIALFLVIAFALFMFIFKDMLFNSVANTKDVNVWNVYIDKVIYDKDKSTVELLEEPVISDSDLGFGVKALLNKPGDILVLEVIIKNDGTFDAVLDNERVFSFYDFQDAYLAEFIDCKKDTIKSKESKKYTVTIKYVEDHVYEDYDESYKEYGEDYRDIYYGFNIMRK